MENYLILPAPLRVVWGFVLFLSLFLIGPAMELLFGSILDRYQLNFEGALVSLFLLTGLFLLFLLLRKVAKIFR